MLSSLRKFNYVRSGIDMTATGTEFVTLEQLKLFDNATKCSPDNVTIQQSEDGVYSVKKGGITSDKLAGDIITDITSISQGRFPSSEGYNFRNNIEVHYTNQDTYHQHSKNTGSSGTYDIYSLSRRFGSAIVHDDMSTIYVFGSIVQPSNNPRTYDMVIERLTSDGVESTDIISMTNMPSTYNSSGYGYYSEYNTVLVKEQDNGSLKIVNTIQSDNSNNKPLYGLVINVSSDNVVNYSITTMANERSSYFTGEPVEFEDGSVAWFYINRWKTSSSGINTERHRKLFLSSDAVFSISEVTIPLSGYGYLWMDDVYNRVEKVNDNQFYIHAYTDMSINGGPTNSQVALEFSKNATSPTNIISPSPFYTGRILSSEVFIDNEKVSKNLSEGKVEDCAFTLSNKGKTINKYVNRTDGTTINCFDNSRDKDIDVTFPYFVITNSDGTVIPVVIPKSVWYDTSNDFYLVDKNSLYESTIVTGTDGDNFTLYYDDYGTYNSVMSEVPTFVYPSNNLDDYRAGHFVRTVIQDNEKYLLYIAFVAKRRTVEGSSWDTYYTCPNIVVIKFKLQ